MRIILCLTLLLAATLTTATPWQSFAISGSKFGIRLNIDVNYQELASGALDPTLIRVSDPDGSPPPGRVGVLALDSAALGKSYRQSIAIDPETHATLQRYRLEQGKEPRLRVLRYTPTGAWDVRWEPEQKGQAQNTWPESHRQFIAFPPETHHQPIADASVLLVRLAEHDWDAAPQFQRLFYSRRDIYRVTARIVREGTTPVDVTVTESGAARRVKETRPSVTIEVTGEPVGVQSARGMEFLGMHGEIEVKLDREWQAPLSIAGRIKIAGKITLKLKSLAR